MFRRDMLKSLLGILIAPFVRVPKPNCAAGWCVTELPSECCCCCLAPESYTMQTYADGKLIEERVVEYYGQQLEVNLDVAACDCDMLTIQAERVL